jgi:hypothetical protein
MENDALSTGICRRDLQVQAFSDDPFYKYSGSSKLILMITRKWGLWEGSSSLERYTISTSKYIPTRRRDFLPSSSLLELSNLEVGGTALLLSNVNSLPVSKVTCQTTGVFTTKVFKNHFTRNIAIIYAIIYWHLYKEAVVLASLYKPCSLASYSRVVNETPCYLQIK